MPVAEEEKREKKEGEQEEGGEAAQRTADPRCNWFEEIVTKNLKIKSDKFKKMAMLPDISDHVVAFLDKENVSSLLFYLNARDDLVATTKYPAVNKKRSIYFLKKGKGAISDKVAQDLISADLCPSTLDHLSVLLDDVYLPLLVNNKNIDTWPEVVGSDVMRHFHKLNGSVFVLSGQAKGKTLLPLPQSTENSPDSEKAILHTLENAVIEWTHQIKDVIKSDSSTPLNEGLNPGPTVEIDFWAAKAANLQCIYDQLMDPKIQKISKILEASKSTYYPAFKNIFDEVVHALEEANDINTYMKPMRPHVELLSSPNDMQEFMKGFRPLVYTLVLVSKHSKFYHTSQHITVILREICNTVIEQTKTYLSPEEIFKSEADEALEKLRTVLKICDMFKNTVFEFKSQTTNAERPWIFENSAVFSRFDMFEARIKNILDLFDTIVEFNRLEKVEVGGTRGKILSSQVVNIFNEFTQALDTFRKIKYDVLDLKSDNFLRDLHIFHDKTDDLDKRIATILCQGFDDCSGIQSCFRLIEIFSGLLNRPTIQSLFEKKYFILLQMFSDDVDQVHKIFLAGKEHPPMHPNMAPVTGAVSWIHELKERIGKIMEKLNALNHSVMQSEEAKRIKIKYDNVYEELESYEQIMFSAWSSNITTESEANLSRPLMVRDENGLLKVNFDPKVVALLREVKYFESLQVKVPDNAKAIFSNSDTFRNYVLNLEHIVKQYNSFQTTLLPVELPLISKRLSDIDQRCEHAISNLNWKSDSVQSYISETASIVGNLSNVLLVTKNNISQVEAMMKTWSNSPLIERKDGKKLLNLEEKTAKLVTVYTQIEKDGEAIHGILKENCKLFGTDESSEDWLNYLKYVDQLVVNGFYNAVKCSLDYLLRNMTESFLKENDLPALFEAKLELDGNKLRFSPSLDEEADDSLMQIFRDLLDDVYKTSSLVPRIARGTNQGYLKEMTDNPDLEKTRQALLEHLRHSTEQCQSYQETYDQYSHLWTENRQEFMKNFLSDEKAANTENSEVHAEERKPIPLEKFEGEIRKFESIHKNIMALESEVSFDGWLRVDIKPLKQSLNVVTKKWSYTLTKYLSDETIETLSDLNRFVKSSKKGLSSKVQEGDYEGLVNAMGLLLAVKHRVVGTDAMFEPLRKTVNLLKQFGVDMPEEVHRLLNDLPEEWSDTKKLSSAMKDQVAPLQAIEVDSLQKKANKFEMKNHQFREDFKKKAPFKFDLGPVRAYEVLDSIQDEVCTMEAEAIALRQSADLFELTIPVYKQLADCRRDIGMLKNVWDLVGLVTFLFDSWKNTLWTAIDIDSLETRCRELTKELRRLDKEMKAWDAYIGLDQMVKDMITSLRAVGELRSNAIRDRHWKQLMKTTGVTFTITEDMKFQDLLRLQLHKFEDEVKGIVDRATKELSMEKVLSELDKTWSVMEFTFELHEGTGTYLIRSSEELIETLEDNQVMLQNMMSSKYVAHFLDQISKWQNSLSTVDSVITLWQEVQQTWSHLENIFKGSEDIRQQLPDDTKRFDGIDSEYRKLMSESVGIPNCVQLCMREGLYELLEGLQGQLALCEKSLAEYLETKRLAFPRFYFVSGSDLLDILAKGNMPHKVAVHLPKLFDNIARLEFETQGTDQTKTAIGMYSKEDEYVPFTKPCECTGPVEVWLNRLVDTMRNTLRSLLGDAVVTYEEKPREQWIFDYPAQITLAGTQIWWTTEVNVAFNRLEEGYENSMKDYYKKQCNQLTNLITLIQGELSKGNRQMIMTICTLDVHARDIVNKLIQEKAENAQCFGWQCQLRLRWDDQEHNDCFINICDAHFRYNYEYLGNTPRLVVTPLTDRCYITLTQALHLIMGGAPAGPGKTETTKDLGRAMAMMVYVFNCSEQMDYKSVGNIFKGLSQSGTWGCFDEFNRIAVEVLSVIATQVKSIQDALRAKKKRFIFQGEEITLVSTVGYFITMNPGYAGRAELPENIKALFRPCSMVVPDLELICEIMLMAEGFVEASILAKKFTTLYKLNRELLSKQDHYDWGLRAIKSVLVVAGSLKRADPKVPEDHVLMRALRDFNLPKIVTDDLSVFNGLIGDLFPKVDIPRKRNEAFEESIRKATVEAGLQAEEIFILKIVQLEELLAVRHCVFVLGNSGTGKSQIWKTLARTYVNMGKKCVCTDLNPKAVTTDDLFGFINPSTREWKDGLFSSIMRDMASTPGTDPKWMILDGDIDPNWIESLNTVMDDNKILTLASNERIPLKPHMRLLFEIGDLKYATPATVSRAGILYVNPGDLGWLPYVQSWLDKREDAAEKSSLTVLFDRYVNVCLEALNSGRFKRAKVENFCMVQTLCNILEGLLTPTNTPKGCDKEWFEIYFVFAAIWAFGGSLFQDQLVDYRVEFSKWWNGEFKQIKLPPNGTVFDYCIEPETKKFISWAEKIPTYQHDPEKPLQSVLVPTSETVRIRYFLDLLADNAKPILLIGPAGSGKTVLIQDKLSAYSDDRLIVNMPFNFYTTAWSLQPIMEKSLEKKAGRNYGPPGTKKLIYFMDDLNMPEVDKYGTASPHTILRQFFDYKHWYDRQKLTLKEIHNVQFIACMNPTAGSFNITQRLQRHFAAFTINLPTVESLQTVYSNILNGHLQSGFAPSIAKYSEKIINSALTLHKKVSSVFLPTAIKFHYVFNLRDLSNVFQGVLFSNKDLIKEPMDFIRLWVHESLRVYSDKMVDAQDQKQFLGIMQEITKKTIDDVDSSAMYAEPLIFSHFVAGTGESKYQSVRDYNHFKKILEDALEQHNEINAVMDLVLFGDAIAHIARISRILESPRGNALLVGVGGSGKQSLARLAAFLSSLQVFQISLRKGYSVVDLKADLAAMYIKTGQKKIPMMFLLTDSQIADEKFLVLINDLLASGNIPGLFSDEEYEAIINAMRNEAKALGLVDTKEVCYDIFIRFVRRYLKVVLCFSPVGSTLRNRCRKFPSVVNCTQIDWFQEWPEQALISVAARFVDSFDLVPKDLRESVTKFMAFAHQSVNDVSQKFKMAERRYTYTTPKSFLEYINLYKSMLERKSGELLKSMERLENGLAKLESTSSQVDDLKARLASQEVELKMKNEEANRLIERVAVDTEKVNKEKAVADNEEKKVDAITKDVAEKARQCMQDLAAAEPALRAAGDALNTLNKNNLTELKSFGSPAPDIIKVVAAVMVLLSPPGKPAKDRSWKAGKGMMAKVDSFLEDLIKFDKEHIDATNLEALAPYLNDPEFNPESIRAKSAAAAGLTSWVINIVGYYRVYCDVEPKRGALETANSVLAASQAKLAEIQAKIADLNNNLNELRMKYEKAVSDKLKCEEDAKRTQETIVLANRLVGGLASEKIRWGEAVSKFKEQETTLTGDVLLAAAFISYVGSFSKKYRQELWDAKWLPYFKESNLKIPLSSDLDPLGLLTTSADIAKWNNEGLPTDRVSLENASMVVNCKRWPLIIDPQLQGVTWIKNREGKNLRLVRLGQRGYLDSIEKAVSSGDTVLIEDIGVWIDPVLDPLIGRNTIKKGRYIKIGDKEIEYDPKFRLIFQTRMANPHYPPEIQAQTTLINFTVTVSGLEDQLLADVVNSERPELERTKADLTKQQNEFKIKLTELEDNLLGRLSAAEGNFLGDYALVENLETTKRTAIEIEQKVEEAKKTEKKINETREMYRPVAARSSLLYFLLNDLNQISPMYQYSLNAYKVVFQTAINTAEASEEIKERVISLIDNITYSVWRYTTRGLFEKDKLIFTAQMTFQILVTQDDLDLPEYDYLLRAPRVFGSTSPVDWISANTWGAIKALSNLEQFKLLANDIEGSSKRWQKYCENEAPENEKLPQEWKNKTALEKLCVLRALRPDRMIYAVRQFVGQKMGSRYIDSTRIPLAKTFEESGPGTPIFFILSPGVDPVKEVEALGKQLGYTEDSGNFNNVSLGQGQEVIAEQRLENAYKNGGWVMLENLHLVSKWLPTLEKKLEILSVGSHPNFRVFLSAEPAADPAYHIIPISILQASIKITNEPPQGMQANLHRALDNFNQEALERCSKENEFKTILFSLCYFHAVVLERRKFGTQGWNRPYPFSTGDLVISVDVLFNYLESFPKVPWTDLRYIFGEIMYGGHISDDWDRRLCSSYLEVYIREDMLEGAFELAPSFQLPPSMDYKEYHRYIDESLPPESPNLYGLHPNAEIGVLSKMADRLFQTMLEMQPRDASSGNTISREEKVKQSLDEIMEKLPDSFNLVELIAKVEERTPYINVAIQECDRMAALTNEIRRSLKELDLGLKGDLTISEAMEALMNSIFFNQVPASWERLAYPSLNGLAVWYGDLLLRIKELEMWVAEFQLPAAVWLSGLFNPQSFLTAIMQTTARKNEWPLDKMALTVDVLKKTREEVNAPPREGAYIHGLFLEGCRWDANAGVLAESLLKELTYSMPVIFVKAVTIDKRDTKNVYECPLYRTRQRGPTYVWTFNLKAKDKPSRWVLAGTALLLSVD